MGRCQHGFPAPRILVIEDESLITTVVVVTLTDEGYDVRSAGDGQAALDLVQRWTPCLILLDILMPVMDGRTFLRRFWQLEHLSTISVVLMSGAGGPLLSDEHIRVADVLRKPFSLDLLLGVVSRLVA
jgi:CheY-like chemotaxis protein